MKSNPKFDELAKECYVKTGSIHSDHFDYVKFGELIVQACVSQVATVGISNFESYATGNIGWAVQTSIEQIKQHFGID